MRSAGRILIAILLCAGCRSPHRSASVTAQEHGSPSLENTATAPAAAADARPAGTAEADPLAHFDHRPRHGGLVLMNGDLHFEVVLDPAGRYQVYFSDAVRHELPATIADEVVVTVTQRSSASEQVRLRIDRGSKRWVGSGEPVREPDAMARISYSANGKPYFIDLPFVRPASSTH